MGLERVLTKRDAIFRVMLDIATTAADNSHYSMLWKLSTIQASELGT